MFEGELDYEEFDVWDDVHFSQPEKALEPYVETDEDQVLYSYLNQLLRDLENSEEQLDRLEKLYHKSSLPQSYNRLALVLYAPGHKRVLVTRAFNNGRWSFAKVFQRILIHPRASQLVSGVFHLQIDFVTVPPLPVRLYDVGMVNRGQLHFEIGIDGLLIRGEDGKFHLFLPGDAYVRSVMGMKQLRDYLHRNFGRNYLQKATLYRIRSKSFLISGETAYPLLRGVPSVYKIEKGDIEEALQLSIEHIKKNQRADGSFLYYYDPSSDSRLDFEHPKRDPETNPYYNILRHSGGGLTCIYHEKYTQTGDTLACLKHCIEYLESCAVYYELDSKPAAYILSEKKSKLGGAGLGLYLVAEYYLLTRDDSFNEFAAALAWHLVGQITDSGEFIYYNIYLNQIVTEADNHKYFSFYYSGEAICGLAKYLSFAPQHEHRFFLDKIKKALDFLILVRPETRAEEYSVLPSDSWLMMGINELWDFPEMRSSVYSQFVFSDAHKMIGNMYKVTDAPYPDYAGSFYYDYGDYPYADGARLEGVMAAYELAVKMDHHQEKERLWKALKLGVWSVMRLVNTEAAIYSAVKPEIALGGVRFKYTRQWFRIDTIQHVAGFFAKLLPYWDSEEGDGKIGTGVK